MRGPGGPDRSNARAALGHLLGLGLWLAACGPAPETAAAGPAHAIEVPARTLAFDEAREALWPDGPDAWRDPTADEQAAVGRVVVALQAAATTGRVPADAVAAARAHGLVVERWTVDGRAVLVLREDVAHRRGAGAWLFAPSSGPSPVVLQAPHVGHDTGTEVLALRAFVHPPPGAAPAALFASTTHRWTQADGRRERRADNPADPTHDRDHLLATTTRALALAGPVTIVQLHGFAQDGEQDPPPGTAAVVSGGRRDGATPLARAVRDALEPTIGPGVRLYPVDVDVLGATTNAELALVADLPTARFLHLELSAEARARLLADPAAADAFWARVLGATTGP